MTELLSTYERAKYIAIVTAQTDSSHVCYIHESLSENEVNDR
ncbi:MAG TPA: hypothetical protein VK067_02490 [Pseudogracilibacillus sp.]|nr:hypothetical protein [Pseudogracilibacillus sp.]